MRITKKLFIICALLILSSSTVWARDFEYNGIAYTVISDFQHTAGTKYGIYTQDIAGNEVSGDVVIPEIVYEGETPFTVVTISAASFVGCTGITSVQLPSSITNIELNAFKNCAGLKSINLPDKLDAIGSSAFENCKQLQSVFIPEGITILENSTFRKCTSLSSVHLPNSLLAIGHECFNECSSLKEINFPEGLKTLNSYCFNGCSSIESVHLPNSVKTIGDGAFWMCSSLASIELPQSLTSIGGSAFSGCSSLVSIELPQSLTSIEGSAFSGCSSLVSIELPQSLTSIERSAFSGCSSLASIELPQSLTSIEGSAFCDCSSLASVKLPQSLTSIGGGAFWRCSSLASIDFPHSLTLIEGYAFCDCSSLASIELPQSLTSIGEFAFFGCSSLTSVELPQSLTSIDENAFAGSGIQQVICQSKNISVAENAFPTLKKCAYSEGIENPFQSCEYSVSYPTGALIEDGFIYNQDRSQLYFAPVNIDENYVVSDEVKRIGNTAFANCGSLRNITLPTALAGIGAQAFGGCNLTNIKSCNPNPPAIEDENAFIQTAYRDAKLMIPDGCFSAYRDAEIWKKFLKIATPDGNGIYVHDLSISNTEANVSVGQTIKLSATVTPSEATNKEVRWGSSNEAVATVDNTGRVSVEGRGEAVITVSTTDGSNLSASCVVKATQPVTGISLSQSEITMSVGEYRILEVIIEPADANDKSVTWITSNPNVAKVENGIVLAVRDGEADIIVTPNGGDLGLMAVCHVVVRTAVSSIQLSAEDVTLKEGEFTTLTATVLPDNASITSVEWSSSDEAVATVSNGLVLAHSVGTAVIRASATDGSGVYADCKITVTDSSGIGDISADPMEEVEYYDINGIRLPSPIDGVYIVKYKDGSTRKVLKK